MHVFTLGNPVRGDDGAGPEVARLLRDRGVEVTEIGEPTRLVDVFPSNGTAIIVDAVIAGGPVGAVMVLDVTDDPLPTDVATSSHTVSLAQGLELARTLDVWPDRVLIVGIEIDEIHPVPGLHAPVERGVGVAADLVHGLVSGTVGLPTRSTP